MRTQARRRFLHSLDSSVDNVLHQSNTGSTSRFTNIPKFLLVDTLLQDSQNLVIDLLLGPTN